MADGDPERSEEARESVSPISHDVPAMESIFRPKTNVRPVDADRSDQRYSIALSLLDFVMAVGDNAIFEAHHSSDSEEGEPPYRATVFWPVRVGSEERLYPMVRARYGGNSRKCQSPLYFLKSETEPYAGAAWFWLGRALTEVKLPALGPGGTLDSWRQKWQSHGVPQRIAQVMGGRPQSYLTKVRSIACIGFDTTYGNMVLCIESTRPFGFVEDCLTPRAKSAYDTVNKLLETHVVDRVRDHSDFWTWGLNTIWPWVTAVTAILPNAWSLYVKGETGNAGRWFARLAPFVPMATLAFAGLGFFPVRKVASESSHFEERLQMFVTRWQHFWLFVTASYLCIGLRQTAEIARQLPERLWNVGIAIFLLAAVDSLFGCYACLTRFSHNGRGNVGNVPHVRPYGRLLVLALGLPLLLSEHVVFTSPAGIAFAVALCLLVGRLDSPLIGTPPAVIAGLYLNAVLVPLSCFLSFAASNAEIQKIFPHVELVTSISRGLSVVLTVALFITVGWLIQGRAIERYLFNLEPVSLAVPRRTFIEAIKEKLRERQEKKRASETE